MEDNYVEPEVVEEAKMVNQEFDKELKQKVKERDLFRCQICGKDQNLQVAHIPSGYDDDRDGKEKKEDQGHRGMGGKKSVNRPENLITLCEKHHNQLDRKSGKSIKIDRWVPSDKDNGLVVFDNQMRRIPQEELYFYSIPPQKVIEEAHQVHNDLMSSLDKMLDNFHSSLEKLYWIKEEELYNFYADNLNVEVHAYPEKEIYTVLNNTDQKQQTDIYLEGEVEREVSLDAEEIIWFNY